MSKDFRPWRDFGYRESTVPTTLERYNSMKSRLHEAIREGNVKTLRSMIQRNPELCSDELDLLHHACWHGHFEVVKLLIENLRLNPQYRSTAACESHLLHGWKKGDTPLHVACRYGHYRILRYLTKRNYCSQAIPNLTTGELPLHIACYHKNLELVKLVSDCDVNAKIKCEVCKNKSNRNRYSLAQEGDTPLHVACRHSNLDTVTYLCKEKHCDTDIQNATGELPLHIACGRSLPDGKTLEMVKLVSDCNVNAQTLEGKDTPLHIASREWKIDIDIIKYLVYVKRCDLNLEDCDGKQPLCNVELVLRLISEDYDSTAVFPELLHRVCRQGKLDDVKLLVEHHNWDPNTLCQASNQFYGLEKGDSPLHVACRYGHTGIVRYLVEEHCVRIIPNIITGELPLHIACYHRDLELVKLVSNCDVNTRTKCHTPSSSYRDLAEGDTPLHVACRQSNLEVVRYLCKEGDTNIQNAAGKLPLHIACGRSQLDGQTLDIVKLVSDCNVNTQAGQGKDTPLHVACRQSNLEVVRYLCEEEHCDTNIQNVAGKLPLHIACGRSQPVGQTLDIVKLVSDCNVNTQTWQGKDTPLHIACRQSNLEVVRYLCEEKHCDTNIQNAAGELPLHVACGRSPSDEQTLKIVELVSDCNVNTQRQFDKFTPLHIACHCLQTNVAKYLVYVKHCNLNVKDCNGEQPFHIAYKKRKNNVELVLMLINNSSDTKVLPDLLHWACRHGKLDIVKLLIEEHNWDPKVQYQDKTMSCGWEFKKGDTLLHVACKYGKTIKIMKYLTEHCDPTVRNSNGELPLHIACAHKSLEVVKLVSNCDVNAKTSHTRNTPLHIACKRGSAEIVKYLVEERHCDTTVRNSSGELPLHIACTHKSLEMVKLVSNCDVNAKTSHTGNTPLHIAYQYGEKSIISFLVEVKFCALTIKNNDGLLPANSEVMLQAKYQQSRNIQDYQVALRQKGALPTRLLKLLISGPPRVGKSSLKWRLVGKKIKVLASTGVADAPVRVTIKKLRQSIAKACGLQWAQLSVDERAAAILVPLLKKTNSIIASEQDEQKAAGCETQAEEGSKVYNATSLESLEMSTHHETAPVRELESHRTEYDEDFVTSNQSVASQSDLFLGDSKSFDNIVTPCTVSDVGSIHSDIWQASESPCQYKKEVESVAVNVNGVNREQATPKPLTISPPQVLAVDPTPRVNVAKQTSMVHSINHTLCPDNIESTAKLLESDSKDSCMSQTSSISVDTTATISTTISTTDTTSISTTATTTCSTTTSSTTDIPLSTYPGFEDLGALVSIPLLQEGDEEKLKELLVNTTTVHIVDTGGQPEFHEILPALVTGPAVNLILFKLNEGLQERYVVEYLSPDGKSSEPYVTSYTNEDVIFQTLSTIVCFSQHGTGASFENSVDQKTVAVLVGTHMDQISQEKKTQEKKIQEVDESLRDRIQKTEFYTDDLVKFFNPSSKQMIVPVDNTETCEDKAGITALREMLDKIFVDRFDEVYVPPSWLIFDLVLRKSGAKTINIHKCLKTAKLCGIESEEEFKKALQYLHHQVGVLMHFPEVSAVKDVVIIELQLLFDRITDVMVNTFTEERTSPFENELFKNKGQFLPKRVRSESRKKQDPLALDKLVKLLEYLHIVAHIVDHSDPSGKKNTYFMPCVLQSAELGIVFHNPDTSPDQPAPLLIRFNCGFCPVGIFCAIVVYLLSETSSSEVKWELSESERLYRNMVTFKVGKAYDKVILIARQTYYEIWLQRQMNTDAFTTLHEICNKVRNQLDDAISVVSDTLHYTYRSVHQFGFYCPQTSCYESHMPPHNHIAVCSYDNPSHMKCLVSDTPSPLPPTCAVWYGRNVDLASVSVGESEGAKPIQQHQTAELRKLPVDHNRLKVADLANLEREVCSVCKWFDLGLELGLSFSTLKKIKLKHRENTDKCLHDMLYSWVTEKDEVKAKGGANWESLVNTLKSPKIGEHKLAAQVSRNHRKKVHLTSAKRPSTSPSLQPHIHPKATPQSALPDSIHQSLYQQQRMRKSPSLVSSKQAQEYTQIQRGRTTSQMSNQTSQHTQIQQTAQQQGVPTLMECIRFRGRERKINIPQEIGIKYYQFGILLLEDATGARVQAIAHKHTNDAEQINLMILQKWIGGRGAKPVEWRTLVEVLNDIELIELASDIAAVKCPDQAN